MFTDNKVNDFLIFIVLIFVTAFLTYFICTYLDLQNFKKCYDTSFQSESCIKYLDY